MFNSVQVRTSNLDPNSAQNLDQSQDSAAAPNASVSSQLAAGMEAPLDRAVETPSKPIPFADREALKSSIKKHRDELQGIMDSVKFGSDAHIGNAGRGFSQLQRMIKKDDGRRAVDFALKMARDGTVVRNHATDPEKKLFRAEVNGVSVELYLKISEGKISELAPPSHMDKTLHELKLNPSTTDKTRSRFLKAFKFTQEHLQGDKTPAAPNSKLNAKQILVISENTNPSLSNMYENDGVKVHQTFYENSIRLREQRTSENSKFWNWIKDSFPFDHGEHSYDLVIGRSLICACDQLYHYARLAESGDIVAVSTCGGVDKKHQEKVLLDVANLLGKNPKAKAYLSVSPRAQYESIEDRSKQRALTLKFWHQTVEKLNREQNDFVILPIFITEDDIPVLQINNGYLARDGRFEKKGDFFGFKIKHKTMID